MITLKEIIWEITDYCKNGCTYCGSSERIAHRDSPSLNDILKIARAIVDYPPEEVNISGGDPLTVPLDAHIKINNMFYHAGIKSKIIVNPKSFKNNKDVLDILDLYKTIGVSVNEEEELEDLESDIFNKIKEKVTIITNFNKSNLWLFDEIFNKVKSINAAWQIQFTIYKEDNAKNAIYNSESACKTLFNKINKAMDEYNFIVVADNMNAGECTAGIASLGINAYGDIIPCLSMYSWCTPEVQGYLLTTIANPLKHIWENKFKEQRFNKFKCCKDACKRIAFVRNPATISPAWPGTPPSAPSWPFPKQNEPIIMMYAVWDKTTVVYGVADRITFTDNTLDQTIWLNTNTISTSQ